MSQGDVQQRELARRGEGLIEPDAGIALLERLMSSSTIAAALAVLPFDWSRVLATYQVLPPFLSEVSTFGVSGVRTRSSAPRPRPKALGDALRSAPLRRRRRAIEDHVRDELRHVLGMSGTLDPDEGFFSLGFDSLSSIELRNRLQMSLGVQLSQTIVFDHPTLRKLTDELVRYLSEVDFVGAAPGSPSAAQQIAVPGKQVDFSALRGQKHDYNLES
jgi:acyl carrier protein